MILTILIFIALLAFVAIYYNLLLSKDIFPKRLEQWNFLYREGNCAPSDLREVFNELLSILCTEFGSHKSFKIVGIYFDDPAKLQHPDEMRYAIGVKVDNFVLDTASSKLEKHGFRFKQLPAVFCIANEVPFRNVMSYFFMEFYKKQVRKFVEKANIKNARSAIVVITDTEGPRPILGVYYPFNKGSEEYRFTTLIEPKICE